VKAAMLALALLCGCSEIPPSDGHLIVLVTRTWDGNVFEIIDTEHHVRCYAGTKSIACLRDDGGGAR
jgi:hypothetical protein